MSSVSMALADMGSTCGSSEGCNPGTLNAWLKQHEGYEGNLFVWEAIKPLGLEYILKFYAVDQIA